MLNEIEEKVYSTIFSIMKLNLDDSKCEKVDKKCRSWNVLRQILKVIYFLY